MAGHVSGGGVWSYRGSTGPSHWAGVCSSGSSQSPVDLTGVERRTLPDWVFTNYDLRPSQMVMNNNGHTVKITINGEKVPRVEGGGLNGNYRLMIFHCLPYFKYTYN